MMAAETRRFDFESQAVHACFEVASLTQGPTRFVTGEL